MSEEKKAKLSTLDEREKEVLNYLMGEKDIKIKDIAKTLYIAESTVRSILTSIYTKLEIRGFGNEKRANLIREYADDYRNLYLRLEGIEAPKEGDTSRPSTPSPQDSKNGSRIDRHPPERQINRNWIIVAGLSGFFIISCITIFVFVTFIRILSRDRQPPPVAIIPTYTETAIIIPTDTLIPTITSSPTFTLVPTDTPLPTLTDTPTLIPTPTQTPEFYLQGQSLEIKPNVFLTIEPKFNAKGYVYCSLEYTVGFSVRFQVTNKSDSQFILRYNWSDFEAVDNLGNSYNFHYSGSPWCSYEPGLRSVTINPNKSEELNLAFEGTFDINTEYILITLKNLSGKGSFVFKKDV